jgi:hypothetical protein
MVAGLCNLLSNQQVIRQHWPARIQATIQQYVSVAYGKVALSLGFERRISNLAQKSCRLDYLIDFTNVNGVLTSEVAQLGACGEPQSTQGYRWKSLIFQGLIFRCRMRPMGLRFRRSIKVMPGVHLNLSGSGLGLSVGPRGLRAGLDAKGRRYVSAGIPGTGLSSRHYVSQADAPTGQQPTAGSQAGALIVFAIIGGAAVLVAVAAAFSWLK